jgi:hypothetical protein
MDEFEEAELTEAELTEAELARLRRRDHDMSAHTRVGMSNGGNKRFKVVGDQIARRGREAKEFLERRETPPADKRDKHY